MNCWKSFNVEKQYGEKFFVIMSFIVILGTFILLYVPILILFGEKPLYDNHLLFFILSFLAIYPVHKCFHFLPLVITRHKFIIQWKVIAYIFPQIMLIVKEPVKKGIYVISLICPFIILNAVIFTGITLFPHYVHYFTILLSFHLGICFTDFVYLKYLVKSPANCFIEESADGYSILTEKKASLS